MTISDHSRYRLHQRLDEVLGTDEASTLMEHLPPVGWADVATKRDLDHLGDQIRAEMHRELGALRGDMRAQVQTLFLGLVGLQMTGAALAVGLSRVL